MGCVLMFVFIALLDTTATYCTLMVLLLTLFSGLRMDTFINTELFHF